MTLRISEICFNCSDPVAMAEFWCAAIGYHETERDDTGVAIAGAPNAPMILMCASTTSIRVARSVTIGCTSICRRRSRTRMRRSPAWSASAARRIDIGQGEPTWVVMADPEGNEFCVLRRPVPPEPAPFAAPEVP